MPLLELFDETLDINSTENYELSVQVSPSNLSFSVLDTLRNKFVLLRAYEPEDPEFFDADKLGELISKDDFLTRRFKKVNLITPATKSTLIPGPLYDETKREEYLNYNFGNDNKEILLTNELHEPEVFLIFTIPAQIYNLLTAYFPGVEFNHQLKPLFHYITGLRRTIDSRYIHVHLEKDFFNILVFDQNTLKFCNTFNYRTSSDLKYYILYVLKRMGSSQEEIVNFSGGFNKYNSLVTGFSDYLRNIRFAEPSGNFTFSYVFSEVDLHKYLNLFIITTCE